MAVVAAIVGLLAAACGGSSPSGQASAAGWSAPLLSGGRFESSAYAGKPFAMWFWAPT